VAISNAPFDLERVLVEISGLIWLLMLILFLKTSDSSKN